MCKNSANKMKPPYLLRYRRLKNWPQVIKKLATGIGRILSFWSTQFKWQHIPVKKWWRKITSLWLDSQINLNPIKVIVLHEYSFTRHLSTIQSRFKHYILEKKNVISNSLLISTFVWSLFTCQCSFHVFMFTNDVLFRIFRFYALKDCLKKKNHSDAVWNFQNFNQS